METTAVYLRISSDQQGTGLGVARQREDCLKLCASRGWTDVQVYEDNDLSAYSGKARPSYERMVGDVRDGRVRRIVAWHPDRLHRSVRDFADFVGLVDSTGVEVATVQSGEVDLSSASGWLGASVLNVLAEYESRHKSDRIRRKMRQNAEAGQSHGGSRPYGWREDRVTLDEDEAAFVRLGLDMVLAGNSVKAIVRRLNAEGSRNTLGGPWTASTLRSTLLRPRNAGQRLHRGEVVEGVVGQWEPLCDVDTLQRVAAILRDPARVTNPGRRGRVHLLSGLALCGVCEGTLRVAMGKPYKGVAHPIYRCQQNHVSRRQDAVDGCVRALVVGRLSREDAVDLLTPPDEPAEVAEARAEVERLRARLDTLAADYADDVMTREQYLTATERTRARLAAAERAAPPVAPRTEALGALVGQADVGAAWDALDVSVRRRVVEVLLDLRLLTTRRGPGFDPASVQVDWRS
jgi:site-specific DNA recombinase